MMMPHKDLAVKKKWKKEYNKKYYQENKESFSEYNKKYKKENKDSIREKNREYVIKNPWVEMTTKAKTRTNLPFNITSEYVKSIWPEDNTCPALGIKFKQGIGGPIDSSPSLDRIIPELGYIKDNVQIVCFLTNKIMSSATPDQVMAVAKHYKKITEEKNAA